MAKRESRWTSIYWDVHPTFPEKRGLFPYVRLTPEFMDCEAAGFPHGLSLNQQFDTEPEAHKFADAVDRFMEEMIRDYKDNG